LKRARIVVATLSVFATTALAGTSPSSARIERESDFLAGWVRSTWSPACAVHEPSSAAVRAAIPPVVWAPCDEPAMHGCERTTSLPFFIRALIDVSIGNAPSGAVRMAMTREYETNGADRARWESVLWDEDAGIRAAWRITDDECVPRPGALGGGTPSMSVASVSADDEGHLAARAWWHIEGEPDELMARKQADHTFGGGTTHEVGAFFDQVTATPGTISFYYGATNELWVMDRFGGERERVEVASGERLFCERGTAASGNTVLFSDERSIWAWTRGVGLRAIRQSPGVSLHDVGTDGHTLAWLESKDEDALASGRYSAATLYASPFVDRADAIEPRAIARIPCPALRCQLVVANGHVVVGGRRAYDVIRLSDGKSWHVGTGAGAVWVANGKVWIALRNEVVRVPLDSLPPGLEP
jgi:hypothetical protein